MEHMKTVKYCFAIVKNEVDQRRLPQIGGGIGGPNPPSSKTHAAN